MRLLKAQSENEMQESFYDVGNVRGMNKDLREINLELFEWFIADHSAVTDAMASWNRIDRLEREKRFNHLDKIIETVHIIS